MNYPTKNQYIHIIANRAHKGFTLVTLMIAVGILSILTVTASQVFDYFSKSKQATEARNTVHQMFGDISETLNFVSNLDEKKQCMLSFSDLPPLNKKKIPNQKIFSIKAGTDSPIDKFVVNEKYESHVAINSIILKNIQKNTDNDKKASAVLQINFKLNNTSIGPDRFSRELNMSFDLDNSFKVTDCLAYGGSLYKDGVIGSVPECKDGGIISYSGGVPVCGKNNQVVNVVKSVMPCHTDQIDDYLPDYFSPFLQWNSNFGAFEGRCVTLHTRSSSTLLEKFGHSPNSLTHNSGALLHTFSYEAKADGKAFIEGIIPVRYFRALHKDYAIGYNQSFSTAFNSYIWVKPLTLDDSFFSYAGGGLLANPFKKPQITNGASYKNHFIASNDATINRNNNNWAHYGASFGGTGNANGEFTTVKGRKYRIKIMVGMPEESPNWLAWPAVWLGTLKVTDNYAEGTIKITEIRLADL